ncbi:MAG: hypothetical protein AB7R55_07305 [Gemmatimonadales bacterium]
MSHPRMFDAFLRAQLEAGLALADASDLLDLTPLPDDPPSRFVARFQAAGLALDETGLIQRAELFEVGIWFPPDYLRRAEPWQVLTWLGPARVFHPNISVRGPWICPGVLHPGTPLVDLLYQCYEIITYQKVTTVEHDALNPAACGWARDNRHRFPIDRRPLKWRRPRPTPPTAKETAE